MTLKTIDDAVNANGVTLYVNGDDHGEGTAEAAIDPGAVVIRGTAAGDLLPAGADAEDALGWSEDNVTNASEDLRAQYAIGDRVGYYRNTGDRFMAIIVTGQALTKGAPLKCAANGRLTLFGAAAAGDGRKIVAHYRGEADVTTSGEERHPVKWVRA